MNVVQLWQLQCADQGHGRMSALRRPAHPMSQSQLEWIGKGRKATSIWSTSVIAHRFATTPDPSTARLRWLADNVSGHVKSHTRQRPLAHGNTYGQAIWARAIVTAQRIWFQQWRYIGGDQRPLDQVVDGVVTHLTAGWLSASEAVCSITSDVNATNTCVWCTHDGPRDEER